jgi:hypothetical protein
MVPVPEIVPAIEEYDQLKLPLGVPVLSSNDALALPRLSPVAAIAASAYLRILM